MGLRRFLREVPDCPVCEGPCREAFERSKWVYPDRLPRAKDGSADPEPVKPKKVNRRGRRPGRDMAVHGPIEDRMRRPSDDR